MTSASSFVSKASKTPNHNITGHNVVAGEAKTVLEVDIDLITVTTNCTANLSVPFYSQYSEDTRIFHKFAEDPKCGGVVVEIGGLDGITFSNSWFFEYALHWKALLIEASADNYAKMVVNRPNATNVFGAVCRGNPSPFNPLTMVQLVVLQRI
ncbi:hypothetical protein MHU86_10124 [Fragilaria crotonensis]|nr:hypothetical protein MHU86_10124 [Fragilaria crotonensis]